MSKGMAIPVGVDKSGGARLEDDPQHLNTILNLALQPGDDDNPFQSIGLDERIIFAVNDPAAQGLARNSIERILRKYTDRLQLDQSQPITFTKTDQGTLQCSFRYINLDTGKATDFTGTIG